MNVSLFDQLLIWKVSGEALLIELATEVTMMRENPHSMIEMAH